MKLTERLLAHYLRTKLRGSHRLTGFLASRLESLQQLPIEVEGGTLFADLRIASARGILAFPTSQSGENLAMRRFVTHGDVVWDIGAHMGYYSVLLSDLVGPYGKVYAFEPNPELFRCLKLTFDHRKNVHLIPAALSEEVGEIELFVPEDASMGSLRDWTNGSAGKVHTVRAKVLVLDELVANQEIAFPSFIKCDVEGAELSVFKGAQGILDRVDAPVLMFELNAKAAHAFGTTIDDYFQFLESLKKPQFAFFEVINKGIRELHSGCYEYANIVAVPSQRLHETLSHSSDV